MNSSCSRSQLKVIVLEMIAELRVNLLVKPGIFINAHLIKIQLSSMHTDDIEAHFNLTLFSFLPFFSAVSPSDNSRAFGLSPVWPLEAPSLKQANGDLRLGPNWRPQSPKSPKSPKVLRLSPQESRYSRTALFLLYKDLITFNVIHFITMLKCF